MKSAVNGYFYMINKNGKHLDVDNGCGFKDGNYMQIYQENKTSDQMFKFIEVKSAFSESFQTSDFAYPTKLKVGESYSLAGKISSNSKITNITAKILNSSGTSIIQKSLAPNKTSYSLLNSPVDNGILFGNLKEGKYTLVIEAPNAFGTKSKLLEKGFTVEPSAQGTLTTFQKDLEKFALSQVGKSHTTYTSAYGFRQLVCYVYLLCFDSNLSKTWVLQ